ncbi:MAG: hypothetical protein QUV71_14515 [Rhizobium sp.]|nr:hypothetical protein [Rhizobium sp.]MDM8014215.1 hypothetical protein [Rhizobium sp.]
MQLIRQVQSTREKMNDASDRVVAAAADVRRAIRDAEAALKKIQKGATAQPLGNAARSISRSATELARCAEALSGLANEVAKGERSRIAKAARLRSIERRWAQWSEELHLDSLENAGSVHLTDFQAGIAKVFWRGKLAGHIGNPTSRFFDRPGTGYVALDPLMKEFRNGRHQCLDLAIRQLLDEIEHRLPPHRSGKR